MLERLSSQDRLYLKYLQVVEGYAWFRTYYAGDAYANETLENLEEAQKHWDKTLIVEPIDEPVASAKRDGFTYVRVTYRHQDDLFADEMVNKRRVLAAIEAKKRSVAFAAALRKIVQGERGLEGTEHEDRVLWACLSAPACQYFQAAIDAMSAAAES